MLSEIDEIGHGECGGMLNLLCKITSRSMF